MMLQGLDQLDWESLGANNDIPQWIRCLASNDRMVRVNAYHNLENNVTSVGSTTHESYGSIHELLNTDIPHLIVPFLIELLISDDIDNKVLVLTLLYDLARQVEDGREGLVEPFRTRAQKVDLAVQAGMNIYKVLITHSDKHIRHAANDLLSVYELMVQVSEF